MKKYTFQEYTKIAKKIAAVVLVAGLITGLGLGAFVIGVTEIVGANASNGWPSVTGTVIRSKVLVSEQSTSRTNQTSRSTKSYTPDVAYRYVVNGKTFNNDNIRYGLATNKASAGRLVKQYPQDKEIEIFYNPGNPEQSVLQPGYFGGLLFFPIMGFLAILAGLFSGYLIWHLQA